MMTIAKQLRPAILAQKKSIYGAAQLIASKTGLPYKTVYRQLKSLVDDRPPLTIQILEQICNTLGLTIRISNEKEVSE